MTDPATDPATRTSAGDRTTDRTTDPTGGGVRDEHAALRTAREAARQAARAAADLAEFAERMSAVLDPAQRAEYAALLSRDEDTRGRRQDAFDALDLGIPSLEEE